MWFIYVVFFKYSEQEKKYIFSFFFIILMCLQLKATQQQENDLKMVNTLMGDGSGGFMFSFLCCVCVFYCEFFSH